MIQAYTQEFEYLWANSRDFVGKTWNTENKAPSSDQFQVATLEPRAFFTSSNFKLTSSRYGQGFTTIEGKNTISDAIVAQIKTALSTIKIASGHFRSHTIAKALLDAKERNPALDILVKFHVKNELIFGFLMDIGIYSGL